MSHTPSSEATLTRLKARHQMLRDASIRIEADTATAQRELARLESEAQALFGTSDTDQLNILLEKWTAENAESVKQYGLSLDEIETDLQLIQAQLNS